MKACTNCGGPIEPGTRHIVRRAGFMCTVAPALHAPACICSQFNDPDPKCPRCYPNNQPSPAPVGCDLNSVVFAARMVLWAWDNRAAMIGSNHEMRHAIEMLRTVTPTEEQFRLTPVSL